MIKSLSCAAAALAFGASAAVAGPYVNVEANAGWSGTDYSGSVTDMALGLSTAKALTASTCRAVLQLSSLTVPTLTWNFPAKLGGSVAASDAFSFYTEISGITGDDNNSYGGKLGSKVQLLT